MSRKVGDFTLESGSILVTGAGGFVGQRLMELFDLGPGDIAADFSDDFTAPAGVRKIVWKLPGPPPASLGQVKYVIHLAGLSSVAHSRSMADKVLSVNTKGTLSIVDWIKQRSPDAILLLASSAEVYRVSSKKLDEMSFIEPQSPYGTSKQKAEEILKNSGVKYLISRSFPHYGPGQSGAFVLPSFCKRIIYTQISGDRKITTGNLSAIRDYLYIDDVIYAYACLLAKGLTGSIYNVCSSEGISIGMLLSRIIKISQFDIETVTDPRLLREKDQFCQIGSNEKLKSLGWTMKVPLELGLLKLYQWWEQRL